MNILSTLFTRTWRLLRRRLGLRGIAAILLLAIALRAVEAGLAGLLTGLRSGETAVTSFSAVAVIAGWLTVRRKGGPLLLAGWIAAGLVAILLQHGQLWDELFALLRTSLAVAAQWVAGRLGEQPPAAPAALTPLHLAWLQLTAGARIELDVLGGWYRGLLAGEPSFRPAGAGLALGTALWTLGLYAGAVMRSTRSPLAALLPAGAALAAGMAYSGEQSTVALAVLLLAALLLAAVQTQFGNERRWAARGMMYAEDLRLDLGVSASVLIGGIVAAAFVIPQLQLGTAIRMFVDRAADPGSGPPGAANQADPGSGAPPFTPPPPFFEQFSEGGLPTSHLLGAGPELADELALEVQVFGEPLPGAGQYYWRGLTYDRYTGRGWETAPTETLRFDAGRQVQGAAAPYARAVRQEVRRVTAPDGIAFAAGEVFTADRIFTIAWRPPAPALADVFGVRIESDDYTVDSIAPYFFPDLLRAAGSAYPDWVTDRYLELPGAVPDRVHALAASLTAEAGSSFDAALSIERYLRRYAYTLELEPPPADVDLADFFLFELQRGYCDYFATAMVVLSRSAGIPARLATGYARGEFDPASGQYVVSALNAHSWPELYFPGFGWVPFEPTSGVAAIDRTAELELPPGPLPDLPPLEPAVPGWARAVGRFAWTALGVAVVVVLGLTLRERGRVRGLGPGEFFAEAYQWVYTAGRRLELETPAMATPLEIERALARRLDALQARSRLAARLPPAAPALRQLAGAYVRMVYRGEQPTEGEKRAGIRALDRLRPIALLARLDRRIGR